MDATKPHEFIGFGAMDATKPYEFIGVGAMDATKPYEFIRFGVAGLDLRSATAEPCQKVCWGAMRPDMPSEAGSEQQNNQTL